MTSEPSSSPPPLSLDHVRSFVTVSEERHFGRAARRLRLTQPPLTRQVQKLERDVGVRLFDRTPSGVELTAAGRAFLPEARRLLALAEAAVTTARQVAAGGAGRLSIGVAEGAGPEVLGPVLTAVEQARPGVALTLHELVTSEQADRLQAGGLDLALIRPGYDPRTLGSVLLLREPLVLALPVGHPLADGDEPLAVTRTAGIPLLSYDPGRAGYLARLVDQVMLPVRPQVIHRLAQVPTLVALVAAGRGAALVPASARRLGVAGVRMRTLVTDPAMPVELCLAWRRDATNPALLAVLPALTAAALTDPALTDPVLTDPALTEAAADPTGEPVSE